METKEMKIVVPEGYEIDHENSTFECIKFKSVKKALTYEEVANTLFHENKCYVPYENGNIAEMCHYNNIGSCNKLNCTSEKQAKKLLAINLMLNVAKYLNGDWAPDWNDYDEYKWQIELDNNGEIGIDYYCAHVYSFVHFKSKEYAKRAIEMLGEETVKLALSTDW